MKKGENFSQLGKSLCSLLFLYCRISFINTLPSLYSMQRIRKIYILHIWIFFYLYIFLFILQSIYISSFVYLFILSFKEWIIYLPIHLYSVNKTYALIIINLSNYMCSVYLSIYLSFSYIIIYLNIYLSNHIYFYILGSVFLRPMCIIINLLITKIIMFYPLPLPSTGR